MIARFHYDDSRLTQLLQDEGSVGSNELLEHLETCEECQARLDTLSSGGLSWDEVNELMRKDDPKVAELVGRYDEQREEPESLATSATFLQPSDYPDSLGRFARYEVMEFLGRGGMGIVMRAYDTALQRNCAVKVLAPELASSAAARKRFSREARSAAAVVHPHVVPIQTVDEHNGLPYLVMPVVDGRSLQQRVEADGPLSVIETVRIASQVAEGLAAAHAQGLVHRDIKPANILLENGVERVQLTDFGLARAIDDASMTRSGVIAGTPQYMSPEQAHGDPIDHRSDLFSLGSVIYFMLTGRSPFRAETTMGVLNRIGNDDPRSLRSINAEVPEWLEAIVIKLLAKSRDGRFATAEEVAALLSGCLAHLQEPTTASLPATTPSFNGKPQASARSQLSQSLNPSRLRLAVMRISRPPYRNFLVAAAFAFFALAGTIIYLETGKGTLRIKTNSESDVPIVIRQGDEVVEHLTVSNQGASMRLKAGSYVLQIDDADSEFIIADGEFVLKRGGQWLARISESQQGKNVDERVSSPSSAQSLPAAPRHYRSIPITPNPSQPLIGTWRLLRWLNANGDPATKVLPDNSVMTIEDSYVTVATEKVSPDENYFYRLLPGDVLHLIETSDNSKGGTETKVKYSFPDPNSLRFETLSNSGGASGWGSEWQRVDEILQSNVAEQIPLATLEPFDLSTKENTEGLADKLGANNNPATTTVANDKNSHFRPAKKTNLAQVNVPTDAEFKPMLLIEWDVDEGISWLFSEPPIRREKLGSFPHAFNLGPNEKPNIPMINSDGRRIKTRWWMECQDANDRFWEMLRGKRIEIPVSNEAYNTVADGGTVRMVIYLPENNGQYADSLDTLKSTQVETDVLELAKERGQPIISVLMEPVSARSSKAIELRDDEVENLEPTGSVTLTQPAEGSKVSSDATIEEWKADRSTPQATLETIDICHLNNPAHVPVDCYTDDALLEMSGVMLQQLGYMSALSQLYSPLDAQIRIQTGGESDAKDSGPIIPGALPAFHLQVDALLNEHSLAMPPEQCKKAFELLLKSTVASLDGKESRVIPDRQLYRLAAGVLQSTREFLPKANELSQQFHDSSSQAVANSKKVVSATQYDIVIKGDEAVATTLVDKDSSAIPMRFKLRRVNERWLVSEVFSDEVLTQINLSMPQITGDTSANESETTKQSPDMSVIRSSTTAVAAKQPLLNTWEEVQDRVAEIVKEREAITNAEVDFKLDSVGERTSKRRYHVWLNNLHRRADCRGVSSDATEDYTHIVTPDYSCYDDHLDKSKSQLGRRDPNDPVGWGTLGCIVDVRKVGLVNWSIESIDTYEFDHDLLPKDLAETSVETGDYEGAPITIVKHRLKTTDATERWIEYWLSPAHGNYPIYIANGWAEPGNPNLKNVVSQRIQWKFIDGIWFPMSVKHHYLSEHRKLDDTNTFTLMGARFNVNPFPNVFEPSIVDVDDDSNAPLTSWNEDLHSKVLSELPENWIDFLALLPETGAALVMCSDQPEIRVQMSPIAKQIAKGAAIRFIEIQQTAPRPDNPPANHFPSTHYLLMKDRHVVDTRYGVLTEEKLREFVAKAADWLTPRSTGVEENSLVRIDCYIFPGTGNIGQQSGDAYPVTAAVVAVHEDQALLLGPDDVAQYMEKGYACVAVVRDADGKEKQFPLEVLFNEPVKLVGRHGRPHRFQVSVRVTHSDGTSSELPITSILPEDELMPQPREKYDVASAIYCIKGVQGLSAVKLAGLGEAISVGERVLSGSFSREPIVPVVLGFSPPLQWQSQTVVTVDGVTGGNTHGPETFGVLCPSLPVPSGYTFDERGRLLGKRLGGNPTNEDMTHDVFKSHATHSILRAALDKIDDAGLKAALLRTLKESSSISEEASVAPHQKRESNNQ